MGCALVLALCGRPAAGSEHDIHFLSEHAPESAMDAHYLALPWPAGRLESGAWQPSVDVSTAATRTDFIDIDGPMIAFAAARGVTRTSGYEVLGFSSRMDVSGSGLGSLSPAFLPDVPLDLPAEADFDARLTGPGFDVATPGEGHALAFGDPFIALSLAFAHRPSGLELDLGGSLTFPAAERVSHAGVDRAFVVHLAWRGKPPRPADD